MTDTTREADARALALQIVEKLSDGWGYDENARAALEIHPIILAALRPAQDAERAFQLGDRVTKISGSKWTGRVVGFYSTALTPEGYAVESETETGSVQIYPAKALRMLD